MFLAGSVLLAQLLTGCASLGNTTVGQPVTACANLLGRTFNQTLVTAAKVVAASDKVPGYCEVLATEIGTSHDMKALLPDAWARRYYQQGGGGMDGVIPELIPEKVNAVQGGGAALRAGAIVLGNNGGHRDPTGAALLNNPGASQRYAHTAIAIARDFGEALAQAYYGGSTEFAYYQGCSNGGRGALNAAAKYGAKFDAVIAGSPTRSDPGVTAQWLRLSQLPLPPYDKLKAVAAAAVSKCDGLDGVQDGIISNWRACAFDPARDVPPEIGLTPSEAGAIKSLMSDIERPQSSTVYSGYGYGFGDKSMKFSSKLYEFLGLGYMRYIVLNDPAWQATGFTVDAYFETIRSVLEDQYQFDAETAGLSAFLASGKKILVWHGSDDTIDSHRDTIRRWEELENAAGAMASQNARLFIPAGVQHCGGGVGPDNFDPFTAMVNWVEKGLAPDALLLTKTDNGLFLSRPLCRYPAYPRYSGAGDIHLAENYSCTH
jgi:feruloyl esterase